jgi:hypothetical protein
VPDSFIAKAKQRLRRRAQDRARVGSLENVVVMPELEPAPAPPLEGEEAAIQRPQPRHRSSAYLAELLARYKP